MERNFIWMWKKEPDVVFENLKRTRVMVKLEDRDWDTAITAIGDVLKVIKEDAKRSVLLSIAHAIQHELFKSKEIDVETIRKVAAFYPRCVEFDDDKYDDDWITAYADFKLSPDAEEDADEADGADDEGEGEGEGEDEDEDDWNLTVEEDNAFVRFLNTDPMEFEEAGINELKKRCNIMGCSLKQGQERQIISFIVSFFTGKNFKIYDESRMEMFVEAFMSKVKGYISSTCILNDPTTVLKAVRSVEKNIRANAYAVHQPNTVPTNECEIATPLYLPEQEEICLTPPECENTKTEDCWSATPMNQPEKVVEYLVDVNFCLTPPLGDMKTEECATRGRSKRKLAQL